MELTGNAAIGLAVAGLAVWLVYKLQLWTNYFSDRKIPYVSGVWPLGSSIRAALFREHYGIEWGNIYKKLAPHKIGGFYIYRKPVVMVRDPEFVHRVYATDFSHFVDRGFTVDEKKDPLDAHLFFLNGERWKYLRNKLSPIFTSGKLKWMFEQMKGSSDKFVNFFDKSVPLGQDTDLRESFTRFTTDVISSCAFGIESNALGDPDSKFREVGKKFFEPNSFELFKFLARFSIPSLLTLLRIRTTSLEITNFFVDLVKQTFDHRTKTGYVRKDFIQLLLVLKEKGHVSLDDEVEVRNGDSLTQMSASATRVHSGSNKQKEVIELDDRVLAAQLFVFFNAGFETTAGTLYHTTYLLSLDQGSQDKAREEARKVFEKHGDFTYESLKDLKYIDNCISESLRLLPPFPFNFRLCTKDYTFPDGTHIQKGQSVVLPTFALHYDPQYYPEPEKFLPERFDDSITNGTYAPFGYGPRICIGKRFAEVEIKLTLAKLLLRYKFSPAASKSDLKDWAVGSLVVRPKKAQCVRVDRIQRVETD